jgi:hypothetical protein
LFRRTDVTPDGIEPRWSTRTREARTGTRRRRASDTKGRSAEDSSFRRDRAPCKHCGETIETDVTACPHCGNQPFAAIKRGSIVAMFVGTILAVTLSNAALMVWFGSLVGVVLFCIGAGVFWIVTERYSPTEYDAGGRTRAARPGLVEH